MTDSVPDLRQAFAHIDHLVEEHAQHANAGERLLSQVEALGQKARLLRDTATDPDGRARAEALVRSIEAMPERFALSDALHTAIRRRDLRRWPMLLDQGQGLVADDPWMARLLLGQLCDLRFGVRAAPYTPDAAVLDRFIEHLVERQVPFPARSVEILTLVNEPDLGAAAKRHLLRWVQGLPIADPALRALIAAEHGFALQTLDHRPDPRFESALFNAWIDRGVAPLVDLPATTDGDAQPLALRDRFPDGYLRLAHAPRLAHGGQPAPTFRATFATPVAWMSNTVQTLNVAAYWFAHAVPEVPPLGLTPSQQELCLTLWRQASEQHRLRIEIDTVPTSRSHRPRL